MTETAPEFSRIVPLSQLGSGSFRLRIEATAEERGRLARRFDLLALDRLIAAVELHRQDGQSVRLDAAFEAEFSQECVVTLEPVAGAVAKSFLADLRPGRGERRRNGARCRGGGVRAAPR